MALPNIRAREENGKQRQEHIRPALTVDYGSVRDGGEAYSENTEAWVVVVSQNIGLIRLRVLEGLEY